MKKTTLIITALLVLASAFSCKQEVAPKPEQMDSQADETLIPGEVILELSDELIQALEQAQSPSTTKSADFNAAAQQLDVSSYERVFPDAGKFEARHRAAGLHRWYRIRFNPQQPHTKADAAIEDLFRIKGVLAVERPRKQESHAFNYFNDTYARYCWFLYNDGTLGTGFKAGSDINVIPVWEQYTTGSQNVIVAVIDSGVDLQHEDLAAVVLPPGEGGSRSFVDGIDPYVIPAGDHGTNVAGIIGAVNNNRKGGSSVAGGGLDGLGGVRIMSCAASDGTSEALNGDTAAALVWAADNGACIANNSWGHGYSTEEEARRGSEQYEKNLSSSRAAIDYFIDYAGIDENGNQVGPMRGGVVFFSSGNKGWRYGTPGSYSRVVAVGAFQQNNAITDYSNYGPWIDVWAPGGGENSAEQMIFGPFVGGYGWMAGTSQAAPNASGVAALLLSYFGGPGFTADELKERLIWGAKFGVLNYKGKETAGGRLDAYGAFTYQGRDPITFSTDYSGGYTFKSHESVQIRYTIHGNEDNMLPVETFSDSPIVDVVADNTSILFKVDALKGKDGSYKAGVIVGKGTVFENTLELTFVIEPNHAPAVVKSIDNLVLNAETGETATIDLSQYISDPDGENLSYKAEVETGSTASASVSGNSLTVKALTYGQTAVVVTGTDARGETAKTSFSVLNRNTSQPADVYPNPASDFVLVRPSRQGSITIQFFNQAGSKVMEVNTNAGLYQPARIDVSSLPTGLYTVVVQIDTDEYRTAIMKI